MKKIFIIFIISQSVFCQNKIEIFPFFENLQKLDFDKNLKNNLTKEKFLLTKIIEDDRQTKLSQLDKRYLKLDTINLKNEEKFLTFLILGFKYLNYQKNKTKSFIYFEKAYQLSQKLKNKNLEKNSLYFLLIFYSKGVLQSNKAYLQYLNLYKKECSTETDWLYFYSFKFNLLSQTETYDENNSNLQKINNKIFIKYDSLIKKSNNLNPKLKAIYYKDKGNLVIRENPNIAKEYFEKAFLTYTKSNYFKFQKFYGLLNLSRVASLQKKHKKGLSYLNKAKKYISHNDSLFDNYDISAFKAGHFYNLKQFDSAYFYEKKVRFLGYEINFQEENQKVSELKVELETEKKEKENLQLKIDKEKNKNLLIAAILTILLGSIIYILSYKNSQRKRKLAEQQKELETQKNLTLIKEQEITTINAMVDGQEKERKRIAEDLHDNLGSVLATLKLHFENLKINREKKKINQETLFNKTEGLIDEAYLKVRSIAHAKNAGVIANKGLLLAVQMMAEKISSADKIKIEVIHFGLDKRLDNSLELTVFRVIQELVTNIIKHAEAKNATINISLYEQNLNIIIEDDGKGFDIHKINLKNGMGISSIKTRIEHLKGTFEVDSTINNGSSIILNIPTA